MATIGTFHKDDNGNYAGAIKTVTLSCLYKHGHACKPVQHQTYTSRVF